MLDIPGRVRIMEAIPHMGDRQKHTTTHIMKHTDIFKAEKLEEAHICVIPHGWEPVSKGNIIKHDKIKVEVLIMAGKRISRTFNTLSLYSYTESGKILDYDWNSASRLPIADVLKPFYNKYGIEDDHAIKSMAAKLIVRTLYWTSHADGALDVFPLHVFLEKAVCYEIYGLDHMTVEQLTHAEVLDAQDKMKQLAMGFYPRLVDAIKNVDNARICGHGLDQFEGAIEMQEQGQCTSLPCLPNMFYGMTGEGGKIYHFVECEQIGA